MGFLGQLFGLQGKGTLRVRVDKPHYISGELITGSLQVDVFEPIDCNEIIVIVKGKEKVSWTEHESRTDDHGHEKAVELKLSERHKIFNQKLVLFNVEHHISPGQYVYPFQYQLPMGLPGCYDNEGESTVKAKIEYSIKGALGIDGTFTRDLKDRKKLTVYAQPAGAVAPSVAERAETVRFCCCLRQGSCSLRLAMDKNMYGPGEIPMIQRDILNQSSQNVTSMRCELVRTVAVRADGQSRTLTKVICSAIFPGVPAGQLISELQPFRLPDRGLYPSTRSQLISCSYCIEVTCDIPWCPDVDLFLPIALGAPMLVPVLSDPA